MVIDERSTIIDRISGERAIGVSVGELGAIGN
jgi:hypothetical protein